MELFIGQVPAVSARVHHVVRYVKLDAQEKLFVLTTFIRFIGLCRVSVMQYMELLDKKLTGPGPGISVHPGVTLFLSFCCDIFSQKTVKLHALQETTPH